MSTVENNQDEPPSSISKLVSLRYRDLKGVDLTGEKGLMAWALGGSDLRGVQLPRSIRFDLLKRLEDSSKLAQNIFIVLLAAALACWLVRVTTSDLEMATSAASASLPLLT